VSARVQLPTALRDYTAGLAEIEVNATTVGAALALLATRHPSLRRHLYTDAGTLRGYVRVYLNDDDVRELAAGEATPLRSGDVIMIVPSIAGGEQPR
jgi:molybdopterin converting factor small subunit